MIKYKAVKRARYSFYTQKMNTIFFIIRIRQVNLSAKPITISRPTISAFFLHKCVRRELV